MKRTDDEIRELILKDLYEVHKNARSLKTARKSISELKRQLKQHGLSEKEIVSNLDYLISAGWVKVEQEVFEFRTPKGFIRKNEKQYFKISDAGINYFEGASRFQKIEKSFSGINVTNIGGVTVLGDSNIIVNKSYVDLYKELSLLSDIIRKSEQLTDTDKLNYVAEIETIKSQLMKPKPDKNIIKQAWEKLKSLATVAGIAAFFERAAKLIGAFI
jgi:hypothetical protein